MANPWFRMYSEFANDPKVQRLSESDQRRFVMLLCIRCSNESASFSNEDVAFVLRVSLDDAAKTKETLLHAGLITGDWVLANPLKTESDRPFAHVWREIRNRIFRRDDYTCQYCGERGRKLECDHVIPVARGGGHDDSNLVTACFACNRSKHDKLVSEWGGA